MLWYTSEWLRICGSWVKSTGIFCLGVVVKVRDSIAIEEHKHRYMNVSTRVAIRENVMVQLPVY